MISRFDHAVIAARDLTEAIRLYRDELGLDANPGGRHTGLGTHNGIVRFGLDYLELLGVYDAAEVKASGPWRTVLLDYLARREGGPVGYCLATDDIQGLARHFRSTGLDAQGPFAMQRARPDGSVLRWQLLIPGGVSWRRPWPFFIQWGMADDERLALEQPGQHPLGATAVVGVSVVVRNLQASVDLYSRQLELTPAGQDDVPGLAARRARFKLGAFTIDLLAPADIGPLQACLADMGEGLYAVMLGVESVAQARNRLEQAGIGLLPASGMPHGRLVPPHRALGARLVLVDDHTL